MKSGAAYEVHGNSELGKIKQAITVSICEIPDAYKHVFVETSERKEGLGLHGPNASFITTSDSQEEARVLPELPRRWLHFSP